MCTIHPPSGVILDMFDHVLLLAPVGRTVYFGDTGEKSSEVVEYFGGYGAIIGSNITPHPSSSSLPSRPRTKARWTGRLYGETPLNTKLWKQPFRS